MRGLHILGLFPRGVRGYRYLYIVINKFAKWPEATPMVKINKQSAVKFIKSIICRFGVPNRIITDNGSQFTSCAFQRYYEDLGIQICYVYVAHPESNGQVERANVEILRGLKTRTYDHLKKHGKKWIDELPCALWGNRTSPSRATGERLSFWCTGLRPSSPRKSPWAPSMSKHMTKPHRTSSDVKMLTLLMKEDGNLLLKMYSTANHSGAISSGSCVVERYRWMI
jgi:hypothetical protein